MLRVSFGTGLWNVAFEPERRKLFRKFCESPCKRLPPDPRYRIGCRKFWHC
ncbi:MAG: hypothetical protein K2O59_09610 [Lachnospiraceae bacterium]|nr:hypothetical protein [Lachnospiraceae bacterium]